MNTIFILQKRKIQSTISQKAVWIFLLFLISVSLKAQPPAPLATAATGKNSSGFTTTWNASAGATGYRIDVATNNTFASIVPGYGNLDVSNVLSYDITGLNANTTYYYRVKAYDGIGASANSNTITAITAPAAPGALVPTVYTATGFTARWNAATGATGYRIDVASDASFSSFVSGYENLTLTNVTTYAVSALSSGTTYYYRVRAFNANGTSPNSITITAITLPAAPVMSAASAIGTNSFTANWNASLGATGYRIDVSTNTGFTALVGAYNNLDIGNVTTYGITGLNPGVTYYCRVKAYNTSGTSANSSYINVPTLPPSPVAIAATPISSTGFSAKWNAATGATGYRIDISTASDFSSFVTGYENLNVNNVTTFAATGLSSATNYYYRVSAYNISGIGANSNTITVLTIPDTPVPANASNFLTTGFTANWTASGGATGYRLDVSTTSAFTTFVTGYNNRDVANVTSFAVTGLTAGTTYYYRVRAYNTSGTSANGTFITSPTLPGTPTAVAATSITSISFAAKWNVLTGATGYYLDVATDAAFTSFVSGYENIDVGNVISYPISGLTIGTSYYYRIRGYNVSGIGATSNTITVITVPGATTANSATAIAATSFYANWDLMSGATTYYLDVSLNENFTSFITGNNNRNAGNVSTIQVTGLTAGTTYYYRVRAANANGTSANSNTITTACLPPAPTASAATNVTGVSFSANWSAANGATGYRIDVSTVNTFASFVTGYDNLDVGNVTTSSITGLTGGTTYYYRVKAYNISGTSANSSTITILIAPQPPVALSVTTVNDNSFSARWNAATSATGYRLDVAIDAGFSSFVSGFNNLNVGNVTSYAVTGLSSTTTYYYRVRAINANGTSDNSNVISILTLPLAPSAVAASNFTVSSFSANWNSVSGADGYRIDVSTNATFTAILGSYNNLNVSNSLTTSVSGLVSGTTYYYRVRAYNATGSSANSNSMSTVTLLSAPTAIAASPISASGFTARWNTLTGAGGYMLDVATDNTFSSFVTGFENLNVFNVTSYAISGLPGGSTYYYRVRAYNASGAGANSNTITVVTLPDAPVASSATNVTTNGFTANWSASVGATGYYLDVSTLATFATFVAGYNNLNVTNVTSFNVTGLATGTTYYYRIRAYNATGSSANSSTITVITKPAAPVAIAASLVTSGSFSANWNAVTGSAGYRLDVSTDIGFSSFIVGFEDLDVGAVTTYAVSGLSGGTTYYYRVRSYNNSGTSVNSNTITVTTIPAAPVSLSAASVFNTGFTANWNASTGATGYRIDISTNPGFTSFITGYNNTDLGNVLTRNVISLTANTTYYYRIRAYNSSGVSANSNVITVITAPVAVVATGASFLNSAGFNANWNATAGATGYRLDVATNNTFTSMVAGFDNYDAGNVTTFAVSGLAGGTTYYYRLRAYNDYGTGPNSNIITVLTVPSSPLANSATSITTTSFTANWSTSIGTTDYYLDVATDAAFTLFVTGFNNRDVNNVTSFSVTGLTAGVTYYYRVRAYNASGTSASSNTISLPTLPAAPVAIDASGIFAFGFTANWNTVSGADGYVLDVATNAGFTAFVTGYQNLDIGSLTSHDIVGLSPGITYYYRVRAYNTSGQSANSNSILVVTIPAAPLATDASNLIATGFSANWEAATGATGYRLDVATDASFTSFVAGYNNLDVSNVTTYSVNAATCGNTYYYRVRAYNGGGASPNSNTIQVTNPFATIASVVHGKRAGYGAVMIQAYPSEGTVNWYTTASGGTSVNTGYTFITPYLSTDATYYVDVTNNGCNSGVRTAVQATVNIITFDVIPSKYTDDAPFELNASASSGLPITYSIVAGETVASVSGNLITLTGIEGQVTVVANQAGNANYAQANVTRIFTVSKRPNSVTMQSIPGKLTLDPDFTVSAIAVYGTINYTSSNTAVATIHPTTGLVRIVGAGTTSIYATVPAGPGYNGCSTFRSFTVNKRTNSVTLNSIPVKNVSDADFSVVATATNGTIIYSSSNTDVATINSSTGLVHIVASGTTTITASVPENANYLAASATKLLTVNKVTNTITLPIIPAKYVDDANFTVTATATSGTITYTSSNTAVATIDASTGEIDVLSAGTTSITATVASTSTHLGASTSKTLTVKKRTNTITIPTIASKYVDDDNFTITATATNGTITYSSSNPAVATIDASTGEVDILSAGSTIIKAVVAESATYLAGTATKTLTVKKRTNAVTLASIPVKYVDDDNFTITATSLEGTITYTSSNPAVATIDASTGEVDVLSAGTTTIKATASATDVYLSAYASKTLSVQKRAQTITWTPISTKYTNSSDFLAEAIASSGLDPVITVVSGPATINAGTVHLTGATGVVTLRATQSGNDIYKSIYKNISFSVVQPISIVVENVNYPENNSSRTIKTIEPDKNTGEIENPEIVVYPNPSSDGIFYISGLPENSNINVLDLSGKILFDGTQSNILSGKLDLSYLSKGIYFITIKIDDKMIKKRIIKTE